MSSPMMKHGFEFVLNRGSCRLPGSGTQRRDGLIDQRPSGVFQMRSFTEDTPETARARLTVEQAKHMPDHMLELATAGQLGLDIGAHLSQYLDP
jgi:hypothetical protein